MKGIILAGGLGTRLKPLTNLTNKHLLPVWNKPMIMYPLNTLLQAGIKDILIITGPEHTGDFMRFLGSGKNYGCTLTYKVQDEAGGIAQALGLSENFANGDSVCVILGDNLFDDTFPNEVASFKKGCMIFLKEVPDAFRFGVPEFKDNKIINILEKPKNPPSKYAVTGLYCYDNSVFTIIKTLKPSNRGELEITDVNNAYLQKGQLEFSIVKGFWSDAGTFDSLKKATQHYSARD
ncbi:UTP--glucose-1-phosphate uridylyltransferase AglF [uncultured archaeon]|nr:UTP--glucose-1-phosphate uridylyltransferase AglF [uncultured archaeon]